VGQEEIAENEFNLNLPRYVDTFEPETTKPMSIAISELIAAESVANNSAKALKELLITAGVQAA